MPLVSIIMRVFNRSEFLAQAIKSSLSQTMPDFELVIIDNSTNSEIVRQIREIINRFADPRIKYKYIENNLHILGALLEGIKTSRGQYISFLDYDDLMFPNNLYINSRLLDEADENIAVIHGSTIYINSQNQLLFTQRLSNHQFIYDYKFFAKQICSTPFSFPSMMIRKQYILNNFKEISSPSTRMGREELPLLLALLKNSYKFLSHPNIIACVRLHHLSYGRGRILDQLHIRDMIYYMKMYKQHYSTNSSVFYVYRFIKRTAGAVSLVLLRKGYFSRLGDILRYFISWLTNQWKILIRFYSIN